MPNINEVFEAARKGRKVTHRNLGEHVYSEGILKRRRDNGRLATCTVSSLELDPDAWTIEPEPKPKPERFEVGQKFALGNGRAEVLAVGGGTFDHVGCIDYGFGDLRWVRLDRFLDEGWELV